MKANASSNVFSPLTKAERLLGVVIPKLVMAVKGPGGEEAENHCLVKITGIYLNILLERKMLVKLL